jgi:hypothetical protein
MGTGGYQSPQRYYSAGSGYYQPQNRGTSGYNGGNYYQRTQGGSQSGGYGGASSQQRRQSAAAPAAASQGFYLSGGISRQYSQWNFDMKSTGSVLNYSDVAWNVLDVKGGYKYGSWVIDGGLQYGMQSGSTKMTDDDITNGGMATSYDGKDASGNPITFTTNTRVLSIGESSKGSLFGVNAGVGLANKFGFGNVRLTPSVGYRMFNYKLNTSNNHGLSVADNWCNDKGNGEKQCPAFSWIWDGSASSGAGMTSGNPDSDDGYSWWHVSDSGTVYVSNGDTFSFSQSGKTHVYDVSWNGPYAAVDIESELGAGGRVDARVELGLPGYHSKGDQPYRPDWQHPTSVEDSKKMFGAMHLGLLASWTTMMGQNFGLTIGLTYDYYSVKGADAKTYINEGFYTDILKQIYGDGTAWGGVESNMYNPIDSGDALVDGHPTAISIKDLYESCGKSWTCTMKSEVNSFYRSVGIRVGLAGKF